MKKTIAKTAMIGGSITGGFVAGYLFSRGINSGFFGQKISFKRSFASQLNLLNEKSTSVKNNLVSIYEKNVAHPIPDLYRATEGLTLTEYDLLDA